MDLIILKSLYSIICATKELKNFLKDDMSEILNKIGEVHYKAAIRALKDANESENFFNTLHLHGDYISKLKTAYEFFCDDISRFRNKLISKVALYHGKNLQNAYTCAIFIAIYYKVYNEKKLVNRYVNNAVEHFEHYVKSVHRYNILLPNGGFIPEFGIKTSEVELFEKLLKELGYDIKINKEHVLPD